jgi:hypothetical protein
MDCSIAECLQPSVLSSPRPLAPARYFQFFFFAQNGLEGPRDSFQRWVKFYKEAQKESRNYNMAPLFYNKYPDEDCENAIRSRSPAGGLQRPGGAAPIPAGDETTWLGGGIDAAETLPKILT